MTAKHVAHFERVAIFFALLGIATGQIGPSKRSPQVPTPVPSFTSSLGFVLKNGTPIRLRLKRTVSSADSHLGDTVDFESVQDVTLNGVVVVSKGALGFGAVTEALPTRKVARGGKLEITVKDIRLSDGESAPLRAVEGGKGRNHAVAMTAGLVASGLFFFPAAPGMLFIHGRDMVIPKGSEVTAYLAEDVNLQTEKFKSIADMAGTNMEIQDGTPSTKMSIGASSHGGFLGRTYVNEYFQLAYRLSPDWVLETGLANKTPSSAHENGFLLLAAVRIPQDLTDLRADASFRLRTVPVQGTAATCKSYVDALANDLSAQGQGKSKGEISEFSVAGHQFVRVDFDSYTGTRDHAVICSQFRDSFLVWNFEGAFRDSLKEAAASVYAIDPWPPMTDPLPEDEPIFISDKTAARLLKKKVQPVYPTSARENSVSGTVHLQAVINRMGVVESLELVEGPMELVPSAVTAVRQWKFKSYVRNGQAVAVTAPITVVYSGPV